MKDVECCAGATPAHTKRYPGRVLRGRPGYQGTQMSGRLYGRRSDVKKLQLTIGYSTALLAKIKPCSRCGRRHEQLLRYFCRPCGSSVHFHTVPTGAFCG